MLYSQVQDIAKQTMAFINSIIRPGMSLQEIRKICENKMMEFGADSFWYWDVGAFVFSGDETTFSVSGREYKTPDSFIKENDIVTIDLSPQKNYIWGDYARTIIIENGKVVKNIENILNEEWRNGLKMEKILHVEMLKFVTTKTTFEELFFYMNEFIVKNGYINLDFMGNLGHSIVREKNKRIYIEKGNNIKLSDVSMFTFEPHISIKNSVFGFKMENIYYFEKNGLMEL